MRLSSAMRQHLALGTKPSTQTVNAIQGAEVALWQPNICCAFAQHVLRGCYPSCPPLMHRSLNKMLVHPGHHVGNHLVTLGFVENLVIEIPVSLQHLVDGHELHPYVVRAVDGAELVVRPVDEQNGNVD